MLKIDWGLHEDTIIYVDDEFDGTGHDMEWFQDLFVQAILKDIDNCMNGSMMKYEFMVLYLEIILHHGF